jgi:NAD-dependent DNA ligase
MTIVPENINNTSNSIEGSILKTLAYFDIFQYPLLKVEIKQFLDQPVTESAIEKALQRLLNEKNIYKVNNFYSLQNNSFLAEKRIEGNIRAEKLLTKAIKNGRFLFRFPFVRAIGISGSLSKQYADEKADIDFFVITKTNRLWIARTIMHIFKKFTFLSGHQHFYCMNFYLDEAALALEDKNIFTAIEIKTLLPVCGKEVMNDFFKANEWTEEFLPTCNFRHQQKAEPKSSWIKNCLEWMLDNRIAGWLDNWLMEITTRRWKKKEQNGMRNNKGQTMCMVTGKHFAWMNPESFNEKVLSLYNEKLRSLKLKMPQWFEEASLSFSVL